MKTPFTLEQFFGVFSNYNQAVYPMQIIFYLISIIAIYLTLKPTSKSDKIISAILAFLWLWMGIVYHLIFFTSINKAAYLFGVAFMAQGILFLIFGVFQDKLAFKFHSGIHGGLGIVLILFALVVYPCLGYVLGHKYPLSPTFGLPCPTTIFTFGLLFLTHKTFPFVLLVIPFIWSVVGLSAAFNFGMAEDISLIISGLLTLSVLFFRNKKYKYRHIG